jgi:predicted nucleotidyltransferase
MNQEIFKEIQTLKRQILPDEKVILFGSQARGDAREDSDWDLLVLLNNSEKKKEYEDKIFDFVMMGWEYGTYISIKVYSENEWKSHPSPLRDNVEREGIEII